MKQVRALDRSRLMHRRSALLPDTLAALDRVLLVTLDLPGQ